MPETSAPPRPDLLADPRVYGEGVPHAEFARRRRDAPVAWVQEPALRRRGGDRAAAVQRGTGFWAVTRYRTVAAASRQPEVYSSAARGAFLPDPVTPADLHRTRQLLVNMDAPEHTTLRRLVASAFTPRAVRELERAIARHTAAVVDRVLGLDVFDAVTDLAAELPLLVLADLLGMPRQDRELLLRWSNNLVGFDDPEYGGGSVDVYQRTFVEAFGYASQLARARRRDPGEDLVSLLVNAELDGRRLTELEFCQTWILLVIAGNETTRHLLSGGLLALSQRPDQLARLVADPGLVSLAVEELARWVTPIMQFRRTAVTDSTLDGQPIAAGDKVVLYYVSANRDSDVFAEPDGLDVGRLPNPHLAFGIGPHFCLGARLARVEAAAMLSELRPHLPRLRLTGPPIRLESNFMNGIKSLPATFAG